MKKRKKTNKVHSILPQPAKMELNNIDVLKYGLWSLRRTNGEKL